MNGLNDLVYNVTQHATLLQQIISDPSSLKTNTSLKREQIDAFIEVVSNDLTMERLQNLSPQSTSEVFWSRAWVRST